MGGLGYQKKRYSLSGFHSAPTVHPLLTASSMPRSFAIVFASSTSPTLCSKTWNSQTRRGHFDPSRRFASATSLQLASTRSSLPPTRYCS